MAWTHGDHSDYAGLIGGAAEGRSDTFLGILVISSERWWARPTDPVLAASTERHKGAV